MALVTASDYALALNKVFFYIDMNFGGIEKYGFPIFAKILPEDFKALMTSYYSYKQTRLGTYGTNAPNRVSNAAPGTNKTTYEDGGNPKESTSPLTW